MMVYCKQHGLYRASLLQSGHTGKKIHPFSYNAYRDRYDNKRHCSLPVCIHCELPMRRKVLLEVKKEELRNDINTFEIEGKSVAVCKIGDGYYAFPDTCSHEEWPLSESYLDGGLIICS